MLKMRTAAILFGAMLALPAAGFAAPAGVPGQTPPATAKSTKPAKSTTSATSHSTQGIVKSIDATSLVIERGSGKKKKDMTFALDASTHRAGDINVGSKVSVHYKGDASRTAVDVQPVKAKTAPKAAAH